MKRKDDWSDAVRRTLLDAEVEPPPGGWARLERERRVVPLPGRRRFRAIAAAAAVLLIGFAAVEVGRRIGRPADTAERELAAAGEASVPEHAFPALRERMIPDSGACAGAEPGPERLAAADVRSRTERPADLAAADALSRPAGPEGLRAASPRLREEVGSEPVPEGAEKPDRTLQESGGADAAESGGAGPATREKADRRTGERAGGRTGEYPNERSDARSGSLSRSEAAVVAAAGPARRRAGKGDGFREGVRSRRPLAFGLFGGGAVSGRTTTPGRVTRSAYALPAADENGVLRLDPAFRYDECSFRHHQPLSVGLTFRKELPHGLSIQSGAVYTYLHSELTPAPGAGEIDQRLHFIGIPLRLDWRFFERRSFSLYIGAGGMLERCVAARLASDRVREPGMQFSASAAFGAQYRLTDVVGLYFEPDLSCYFTRTDLETARTRSPLTFTLRLGVRFSF